MSLANIRRLLQEDTILHLPAITALAASRKQVVSIMAFESCLLENGNLQIIQMCILHINTQGKVLWSYDSIAPNAPLSQGLLKTHALDETQLNKSPTWAKGWSHAIWHMAEHNTIVVAQNEDLQVIKQQCMHSNGQPPNFANSLSLRDIFHLRHPNKSTAMKDMTAYYQVYLDPEKHLKAQIVTYAKLLEKMLSEQANPQYLSSEMTEKDATATPVLSTWTDAKRWLIRADAGANTPLDFFTKIVEHFPLRVVHNQRKIQGYSVMVDGQWVKSTQLAEQLSWAQIAQDHHWLLDEKQLHDIIALK